MSSNCFLSFGENGQTVLKVNQKFHEIKLPDGFSDVQNFKITASLHSSIIFLCATLKRQPSEAKS